LNQTYDAFAILQEGAKVPTHRHVYIAEQRGRQGNYGHFLPGNFRASLVALQAEILYNGCGDFAGQIPSASLIVYNLKGVS